MFNRVFKLLPMGAIAFSVVFFNCAKSNAQSVDDYSQDLGQVTNVNQLRDVAPTGLGLRGFEEFSRSLWLYFRFSQPNLQR